MKAVVTGTTPRNRAIRVAACIVTDARPRTIAWTRRISKASASGSPVVAWACAPRFIADRARLAPHARLTRYAIGTRLRACVSPGVARTRATDATRRRLAWPRDIDALGTKRRACVRVHVVRTRYRTVVDVGRVRRNVSATPRGGHRHRRRRRQWRHLRPRRRRGGGPPPLRASGTTRSTFASRVRKTAIRSAFRKATW